jgi:hypothetical protein
MRVLRLCALQRHAPRREGAIRRAILILPRPVPIIKEERTKEHCSDVQCLVVEPARCKCMNSLIDIFRCRAYTHSILANVLMHSSLYLDHPP